MIAIEGMPLVPGQAAGEAVVIQSGPAGGDRVEDTRHARERFAEAQQAAGAALRTRLERLADGSARHILSAHLALIADPMLVTAVARHIDAGLGMFWAMSSAF